MEISFVNKSKNVQPNQIQDQASDPAKNISTEENKKYINKNKIDSLEISSSHSGSYEDKKIAVAKSAILYEVTTKTDDKRIQELKDRIENGTYEVPANLIADAILKK
ncbi:MAG: flagellar biosynthesis anti-sigma factor FlgM [Anaerovoracaceae bacterium]